MAQLPLIFPMPVVFQQGASGQLLGVADGAITDAKVANGAGIASAKCYQRFTARHAQISGTAATAETRFFYAATAAGNALDVNAGIDAAAVGAAVVTIDVRKSTGGGAFATILSSVITINSSSAIRTAIAGAIAAAAYIAGDVFEVVITAAAGGGTLPQGVWVQMTVDQAPN